MLIHQRFIPGLAIASYIVGDEKTGEAAVIDPTRDVGDFLRYAEEHGLHIRHIVETHVHADFVSGSRELKARLNDEPVIHCSGYGGEDWTQPYADRPFKEGDEIRLGKVRLGCLHTPGHTPEHVSFLAAESKEFRAPNNERIKKLEGALAPLFKESNRSEACRVHVVHEGGQWALIIRHGEPVSRIGTITDGGESGSLLFRPERLDVAYYNAGKREWLVSGGSTILKEMYREQIGTILHGSRHALSPSDRYSLQPLRQGSDWLNDHGIDGVRAALLKEITLRLPTGVDMKLSKGDVFAELMRQRDVHGDGIEFVDATFALLLSHRKRTLHVKVNPLRNIVSGTGGIGIVDGWLEDRGFIIADANTPILANS